MGSNADAEQIQRSLECFEFDLRQSSEFVVSIENVAERTADEIRRFRPRVQWELAGFVAKTERAQVIKPEDVIGMTVGEKHGVNFPNMFADSLLAEVRSGIDEDWSCLRIPPERRAGFDGRGDRKSGTRRSRTQWWALPSRCRCPAP